MVLPVWLVPALIAGSTAVSFMGSMNQSANLRKSMLIDRRNAQNRANQLKDIANREASKRLSTLRTLQAASGTQLGTGSNLLQTVETLKQIDKRGSSLLAKEAYSRGTNLLGGVFKTIEGGTNSGLFTRAD